MAGIKQFLGKTFIVGYGAGNSSHNAYASQWTDNIGGSEYNNLTEGKLPEQGTYPLHGNGKSQADIFETTSRPPRPLSRMSSTSSRFGGQRGPPEAAGSDTSRPMSMASSAAPIGAVPGRDRPTSMASSSAGGPADPVSYSNTDRPAGSYSDAASMNSIQHSNAGDFQTRARAHAQTNANAPANRRGSFSSGYDEVVEGTAPTVGTYPLRGNSKATFPLTPKAPKSTAYDNLREGQAPRMGTMPLHGNPQADLQRARSRAQRDQEERGRSNSRPVSSYSQFSQSAISRSRSGPRVPRRSHSGARYAAGEPTNRRSMSISSASRNEQNRDSAVVDDPNTYTDLSDPNTYTDFSDPKIPPLDDSSQGGPSSRPKLESRVQSSGGQSARTPIADEFSSMSWYARSEPDQKHDPTTDAVKMHEEKQPIPPIPVADTAPAEQSQPSQQPETDSAVSIEPSKPSEQPTPIPVASPEPLKPHEEPVKSDEPLKADKDIVTPHEEPVIPIEEPLKSLEEPVIPIEEPAIPLEEPVKTEDELVKTEKEPVKPSEEPAKAEEEPVKTEDELVKTEKEPAKPSEEPAKTEEEPVKLSEEPVIKHHEDWIKAHEEPVASPAVSRVEPKAEEKSTLEPPDSDTRPMTQVSTGSSNALDRVDTVETRDFVYYASLGGIVPTDIPVAEVRTKRGSVRYNLGKAFLPGYEERNVKMTKADREALKRQKSESQSQSRSLSLSQSQSQPQPQPQPEKTTKADSNDREAADEIALPSKTEDALTPTNTRIDGSQPNALSLGAIADSDVVSQSKASSQFKTGRRKSLRLGLQKIFMPYLFDDDVPPPPSSNSQTQSQSQAGPTQDAKTTSSSRSSRAASNATSSARRASSSSDIARPSSISAQQNDQANVYSDYSSVPQVSESVMRRHNSRQNRISSGAIPPSPLGTNGTKSNGEGSSYFDYTDTSNQEKPEIRPGKQQVYTQPLTVQGAEQAPSLEGVVDLNNTLETHHDTKIAQAVYHDTIRPVVHHIREERVTREVHSHDVHHRIQPVVDVQVLPTKHFVADGAGGYKEISADNMSGRAIDHHNNQNWVVAETVSGGASGQEGIATGGEEATGQVGQQQQQEKQRQKMYGSRDIIPGIVKDFTARTFEGKEGDYEEWIGEDGVRHTRTTWVHRPALATGAMNAGQTEPIDLGQASNSLVEPKSVDAATGEKKESGHAHNDDDNTNTQKGKTSTLEEDLQTKLSLKD